MAARNGMNIEAGIDLSQFEKDLKTLNKELKTVTGQKLVAELTIDGSNIKKSLQHEFKSAQTEWKNAFKEIEKIQFSKKGQLVNVQDIKDAQKAIEQFRKEYQKAFKVGDKTAMDAAANNIAKLQRYVAAVGKLSDASAKLGIATTPKAKAAMKAERAEIDREIKSLERRKQLLSTNPNMSTIDRLREELALTNQIIKKRQQRMATYASGRSNVDEKHLTTLRAQSAEIQRQIRANSQNNSILGSQGSILSRLKTLATRYLDVFMLSRLGEQIAKTTGYFEKQQVALEGIVGSATKAAEIMGQIKAFAPNSPFQTKDLIKFTKQLAAYNISPDELFPKTKMLADLSAGLGVDMNRIILAYGQVNAAAVLRGQELRQFTEAGIPMVQKLAEKFSQLRGEVVSTGQVFELISKRQVPFEMVSQILTEMTSEGGKFYKMQENLMETTYGQIEKLKDLWTLSLNDIGSTARGTINGVIKLLQKLVKNASSLLKGLFPAAIIINIGEAITKFKLLQKEIGFTAALGKSLWGLAGVAIGGIIAYTSKLWEENHKIEKQFDEIHKAFQKQTRNAISGLDELIRKFRETKEGTKAYKDAFDTLTANYSQYITVTDEYVQKLLTEQETYDALVNAIQKYNEALEKKQQLEQTKATLGDAFEFKEWQGEGLKNFLHPGNTRWFGFNAGFKKQYGMDYNEANDMFKDVMKNVLNTMRDKNLLSLNEDRKIREKENRDIFMDLLPNAMKRGGLNDIFGKFSQEGIDDLWKHFNSKSLEDNDSGRVYANYRRLRKEELGIGSSDFAWISRIDKTFEGLSDQLATELKAATPEQYSREYNARWIGRALEYIGNEKGDFAQLGKKDKDGKLIEQYAKAEYDELIAVMQRETKRDKNGNLTNFDYASVSNVENAFRKYHEAIGNIDQDAAAMLHHLMDVFTKGTDEATGQVAAVRETIFKTFGNDQEKMKIARRFLPNDSNFNDIRNKLPQEHISILEKLRQYGVELDNTIPGKRYKVDSGRKHSKQVLAEIERLKQEEQVISKLMEAEQEGVTITVQDANGKPISAQLFDIMDRERDTKSGTGNREIPDIFNIFKGAYDLYKKAIQEGGIERGIAEMRSNKTVQDMYGGMFGGTGGVDFNTKVGNKTLGEIISENLIEGGLEDGIVDFRKAGTALAEEMKAYGRANEKERGAYIRIAEQIEKWVTETFSKDAVDQWLKELAQGLKDLTVDFEARRADVDLYRKLIANGTESTLGLSVPNVTNAKDAMSLNSSIIRAYIGKMVMDYNSSLRSLANETGMDYTPYQLKGDTKSLAGIAEALKSLTDPNDVNNQAFAATETGKLVMEKLVNALQQLDKTMREELAKIGGTKHSGNSLSDAIANALLKGEAAAKLNEQAQKNAQDKGYGTDEEAIAARQATAKQSADDIFKAFLNSNDFNTLFAASHQPIDFDELWTKLDTIIKKLPEPEKRELLNRKEELDGQVRLFNAARGDFAPFFSGLTDYRTAGSRAEQVWAGYKKTGEDLGASFIKEENRFSLKGITNPEVLAKLNSLNQALESVGDHGKKLAGVFRKQALDGVKAFCDTAQSSFDSMAGIIKNLVGAVKSFANAFSKAYDVMNDGENPDWMKDTEAFLGDFAENFEALIAPMTAVIALIVGITVAITVCEAVATPLLIIMAAVVAAAAIIAGIIAAFQQHDRRLEHSIEDLKKEVEEFDNAITNLNAAAERNVGFEKLRKNIAATGKEIEKATAYSEMWRLENEKKNSDTDKLDEYEQSYQEALDAFLNGIRDVRDEMVSATEEWADAMGSAIRSAFQNGENAARAFRDSVKTMIGDVIEKMLQMAILEPLIENAIESWTNSDMLRQKYTKESTYTDENGQVIKRSEFDQDNYLKELLQNIMDPDKAEDFYRNMLMIGDTLIDTVNGLPANLQDFYKHNSELSTLSGGIESVTEDTARRIEALGNSQLGEMIAIRLLLENYFNAGDGYGNSMMANLQAATVKIANDTSFIRQYTLDVLNEIRSLRTSPSQPLHVTMS